MYAKKTHYTYFVVLAVYFLFVIGILILGKFNIRLFSENNDYISGRKILQLSNCSPRSVEEFPQDFMTRKERESGGIIFHVVVTIYLFMALAIVCDEYFVASLERICEVLNLKRDIAGATFMAAGSSAPELCTAIIGVFITQSDVGVSTIIGSAVFNVLCIVAICGIFAGKVIHLTWWPLFRDCIIYCLSIILLIIILNDSLISWYEALIMLIIYALYIILLYNDSKVNMFVVKLLPKFEVKSSMEKNPLIIRYTPNAIGMMESSDEEEIMETGDVDSTHSKVVLSEDMSNIEGTPPSMFEIPDSFCSRLYWITMLPVTILYYLTIPDCRKPGCWRNLFFVTFIVSVVWISVFTYILVWMLCLTGDTLQIPDTIIGLTFLAAGTSIPDALSGYLVAKEGFGDMALSNSIGSNIFDILICLGLPWIIRTGMLNPGQMIPVSSTGLLYTTITLLSTVVILVGTIMINKWKLNRLLGFIFLLFYIVVITFSCLYELNIFGPFSLPPCPRTRF